MVSTTGFGPFSDLAVIYRWAAEIWKGNYTGLYPYPLMVLLSPLTLLPLDVVAILWLAAMLVIMVVTLKRESLYWMFYIPFLQGLFLGQIDLFFWLAYRSKRPAIWALLSLKPQLLLLVLPRLLTDKRKILEFLAAVAVLHVPFLILRPAWPVEWLGFLSTYQNRMTEIPGTTVSGQILFSPWALPFLALILLLGFFRRKNVEAAFFLANPFLLPYDYSLLMGDVSKIILPLSWLSLGVAWRVGAGWPYALMLVAVLLFETIRERRIKTPEPVQKLPPSSPD